MNICVNVKTRFQFNGPGADRILSCETREEDNFTETEIRFDFGNRPPQPVSVEWNEPCVNICGTWSPIVGFNRGLTPDWQPVMVESRFAIGTPILCFVGTGYNNRLTVVLSEAVQLTKISAGYVEEDSTVICKIRLFEACRMPLGKYILKFRFDRRNVPFYRSVTDAVQYLEDLYPIPRQSAYARQPVFSTWYRHHQNITAEILISDCKKFKAMGMDTMIVDDGWQVDNALRGYAYIGDWKESKSKFPDVKQFVKTIHNIGMKVCFWFAMGFIGDFSEAAGIFAGKYLGKYNYSEHVNIVDPRFPEIRKFFADKIVDSVKAWELDGIKLDFVDVFHSVGETPFREGMDFYGLDEAIEALCREIYTRLLEINRDILIEYRQKYIGVAARQYCNMIRVLDCPGSALLNRVGTLDLRLTSGETSVHSDMLIWNNGENVDDAALQLTAILFAVPQISVRSESLTLNRRKMLRFYMDFWKKNKDILLCPTMIIRNPIGNYASATAIKDNHAITVVYAEYIVPVGEYREHTIINGSGIRGFCVECLDQVAYDVFDCTGKRISAGELAFGVSRIAVPSGGMLKFYK